MLIVFCLRIVYGGHLPTPRRSYGVAPRKRACTYCRPVEGHFPEWHCYLATRFSLVRCKEKSMFSGCCDCSKAILVVLQKGRWKTKSQGSGFFLITKFNLVLPSAGRQSSGTVQEMLNLILLLQKLPRSCPEREGQRYSVWTLFWK